MVTRNQESNHVQEVEVSRALSRPVATSELAQGSEQMLPVLRLHLSGMSPLAVRTAGALARDNHGEAPAIPHVKICLYEGSIEVNGGRVSIPVGLSGAMTGKAFKDSVGIYQGNALYVHRNGGMQRVRDNDTVELVHDAEFTHRRERPVIRSVGRYHRD